MQKEEVACRPVIPDGFVEEVLEKVYGLKVLTAKPLDGYEDCNFAVTVDPQFDNEHIRELWPHGYVFKIFNTVTSRIPESHESERLLMKHLHGRGFPVQDWVYTRNGKHITYQTINENGETHHHLIRLMTYLPGNSMRDYPYTPDLLHEDGIFVAKVTLAIQDFDEDVNHKEETKWGLSCIPTLMDYLDVLEPGDKLLVQDIVKSFNEEIDTSKFYKGYTHGDMNDTNVLLLPDQDRKGSYKFSGLIDFGDCSYSHYIYELAINIAYAMIEANDNMDPLDVPGHILAGYLSLRKLNDLELDALRILVAGRFCQSLVYGIHAYKTDPGNDYLIHTAENGGWSVLYTFWAESLEKYRSRWRTIVSNQSQQIL